MGLFSKKVVVSAPVDAKKLITSTGLATHNKNEDLVFDVPEDYAGCVIYNKECYVFFPEESVIPQVKELCMLPAKFFTQGQQYKFYLVNLNYRFDTIKAAVTDMYYFKEKLPGVEIKCTFRVDFYISLLKNRRDALKSVVKKNANNMDGLHQAIQDEVAPVLKKVVAKYLDAELANCGHKYEEFTKSNHMDKVQAEVFRSLKEQLADFGVKPRELELNIFTPEEGEQRLSKVNDLTYEKIIDDMEHEFHDKARVDLKEDREHEARMAGVNSANDTTVKVTTYSCPQCGNAVQSTFAFCPFCNKNLK